MLNFVQKANYLTNKKLMMIYFKLKNILTAMLILIAFAIFTTSCEREAILPDSISALEKSKMDKKDFNGDSYANSLKTCIPQAPSADYIDYILRDFLIPNTERFLNTPNSVRAGDVQKRYGTIVRYLNSKLCTTLDDTPVWNDGLPQLVLVPEVKGCSDDVTRALFSSLASIFLNIMLYCYHS